MFWYIIFFVFFMISAVQPAIKQAALKASRQKLISNIEKKEQL